MERRVGSGLEGRSDGGGPAAMDGAVSADDLPARRQWGLCPRVRACDAAWPVGADSAAKRRGRSPEACSVWLNGQVGGLTVVNGGRCGAG